ncbi:Diamine acetyltransferase 2 [Papilio machaon]|uniref:Diamine acetyltransferase 2 n=1 Tax=Papilio machaon TaxID=76193 RepID=A0A0N1IE03_PAPMA|nr:Diamine acetyltransferase 2 [Papilio machaon]
MTGSACRCTDLAADGFDSRPPWFLLLVAELEREVVGYALCNRAYSSWTRRALYIEDLYVAETRRRAGVGRALLREVCARALAAGVTRIDWHVLESNRAARALYARMGARDLCRSEGRLALRLDAPRILAVAEGRLLPHRDPASDAS